MLLILSVGWKENTETKKNCENSLCEFYVIKYGLEDVMKVYKGEISTEEFEKGRFCIYCGKAKW